MPKIFISYGRDESYGQNLATKVQSQLQALGFEVFRDVIGLKPGDVWYSRLEFELDSSDLVILIISEKIRTSEWVHNEISMSKEIGLPIIPVIAEKIRMPLWLRHLQTLDFSVEADWPLLIQSVLEYVGDSAEKTKADRVSLAPKLLSIPLAKDQNVPVYQSGDLEAVVFMDGVRYIIIATADLSPEELQDRLPELIKIGSTIDHLSELVKTANLGVELVALNHVPKAIPYSDKSAYFELLYESDKSKAHWEQITLNKRISLHINAVIEELQLKIIIYPSKD